MPRPIQATIHTSAVRHNLQRVRQSVGSSRVWAVVKANAYGHGIARVFPALSQADGFALLDINEATLLRELGWKGPILLLEGTFAAQDLDVCAEHDIWHAVHCRQQLEWLQAWRGAYRHHVFLKLNGGMNRLGFTPDAFGTARQALRGLACVAQTGLMMHFSDADAQRQGQDGTAYQIAAFQQATQGMDDDPRTLSNSAAILRHGSGLPARSDWVRAGIVLYGSSPDFPEHDVAHWDLQPTMTLTGRILAEQSLKAADTVGYGSTFIADGPMRIGIVSCGYADGYPRHAPTGTPVLVNGVRTRTIGRVSMDMLAVDLTPVPDAGFGSEVTLWGRSAINGQALPIDEVAHACGTVGYELMCALAPRVPVRVD